MRLTQDDPAAFRALYGSLAGPASDLARRRLGGDRGAAEAAVQDVFLRVWETRHRWDPSRGSFATWVFVLTRHAIADHVRRARHHVGDPLEPLLLESADPIADPIFEEVEAAESVRAMLDHLSPEQAQVMRLVYVEGLTTREAAQHLNISQGTVKSRIRLATLHLRRQFPEGVL